MARGHSTDGGGGFWLALAMITIWLIGQIAGWSGR